MVSATGNHWWLDGIVAIALLEVALGIDTLGRRLAARHRARAADPATGPPAGDPVPVEAELVADG